MALTRDEYAYIDERLTERISDMIHHNRRRRYRPEAWEWKGFACAVIGANAVDLTDEEHQQLWQQLEAICAHFQTSAPPARTRIRRRHTVQAR